MRVVISRLDLVEYYAKQGSDGWVCARFAYNNPAMVADILGIRYIEDDDIFVLNIPPKYPISDFIRLFYTAGELSKQFKGEVI